MPDHGIYEKVDIHGAVPGFIIRHTRPGSEIVKSHWHQELEINTAFEGSSRFFINGRVEDVTPQHVVLVNSREVHSSIPYFPTDGFAVTGITLQISYPFLKSLVPNYDDYYFVLTQEANAKIHSLILALNEWYEQENTPFLQVLVIRQICEIVYILLSQCCQKRDQTREDTSQEPFQKLEGILSYIHEHYSEPLHSAQVAQQFFFSKEYFCRFFKKYTGVTFSQYLAKYRVLQAEQLLSHTSKKISEIAQETGFADEGSFIQHFRKYYGLTPRNYRNDIIQNPFFRQE